MINFDEMQRLINEVGNLCDNTESETMKVREDIKLEQEKLYKSLIADLRPYLAIAKTLNERKMGNHMEIPFSDPDENGYRLTLVFHKGRRVWIISTKDNTYSAISGDICFDGDFYPYKNTTYGSTMHEICSNWFTKYKANFEKNFTDTVQKMLADKAEAVNEGYEYYRKTLEEIK